MKIDIQNAAYVAKVWKLNSERNAKDKRHLAIKEERRLFTIFIERYREDKWAL